MFYNSNYSYLVKTILLNIIIVVYCNSNDKFKHFKGKHSFPKHNYLGYETANEFELVIPSNIQKDSSLSVNINYNITLVTPLVINNDDIVTVYFESSKPNTTDWIGIRYYYSLLLLYIYIYLYVLYNLHIYIILIFYNNTCYIYTIYIM